MMFQVYIIQKESLIPRGVTVLFLYSSCILLVCMKDDTSPEMRFALNPVVTTLTVVVTSLYLTNKL